MERRLFVLNAATLNGTALVIWEINIKYELCGTVGNVVTFRSEGPDYIMPSMFTSRSIGME